MSLLQTERGLTFAFQMMSRCPKTADHSCRVSIPDTIMYQHGSLRLWYHNENGEVTKRDKRESTKEKIMEVFTHGAPAAHPVAVYMKYPIDPNTSGKSETLSMEYFDTAGLYTFLNEREDKHNGVLQMFVRGSSEKNSVVQCVWSPYHTHTSQRQNVHSLKELSVPLFERCSAMETDAHLSREVKTTPLMVKTLTNECRKIVDHFYQLEQRGIARMILFFKFDAKRVPSLLWASEIVMTLNPLLGPSRDNYRSDGTGAPVTAALASATKAQTIHEDIAWDMMSLLRRTLLHISPGTSDATKVVKRNALAMDEATARGYSLANLSPVFSPKATHEHLSSPAVQRRILKCRLTESVLSEAQIEAASRMSRTGSVGRTTPNVYGQPKPSSPMPSLNSTLRSSTGKSITLSSKFKGCGLKYCAGGGGGFYSQARPSSAMSRPTKTDNDQPMLGDSDAGLYASSFYDDGAGFLSPRGPPRAAAPTEEVKGEAYGEEVEEVEDRGDPEEDPKGTSPEALPENASPGATWNTTSHENAASMRHVRGASPTAPKRRDFTILLSAAMLEYQDATRMEHEAAADTVDDITRMLKTAYDERLMKHTVEIEAPPVLHECFLPALAAALNGDAPPSPPPPPPPATKTPTSSQSSPMVPVSPIKAEGDDVIEVASDGDTVHAVPAQDVSGLSEGPLSEATLPPPLQRTFSVVVERNMRALSMRLRLLKLSIESSARFLRVEVLKQVHEECARATDILGHGGDASPALVFRKTLVCMAAEHSLRTLAFVRNASKRMVDQEEKLVATEWPPRTVFRILPTPYRFKEGLFPLPPSVAITKPPRLRVTL